MDRFRERYGEWALVAGAAEGIGAAFTEVLARRRMNVVMVDINRKAMEQLAARMKKQYGVEIRTLPLDLASEEAWKTCAESITDIDCRLLVYVAAFSKVKPFFDNSPDELEQYIRVNNLTALRMVYGFAKPLKVRSVTGGILLISSLSGIIPPPLVAPYAATKSFLLRLAESLSQEFSPLGIDISACAAGITGTPTYFASQPRESLFTPKAMDPLKVAGFAIEKLGRQAICIPGRKNRLTCFLLTRLLPRRMSVRITGWQMRKMYAKKK